MHYKTIVLELLEQNPGVHERLRKNRNQPLHPFDSVPSHQTKVDEPEAAAQPEPTPGLDARYECASATRLPA
jgi:hypothetical protein